MSLWRNIFIDTTYMLVSIENNINKENIIKLIDKYQHKYYIDELEETMNN